MHSFPPIQWRAFAAAPPETMRLRLNDAFAAGRARVQQRLVLSGLAVFDLQVAPPDLPVLHAALGAIGLRLDVPSALLPTDLAVPVATVVLGVTFQQSDPMEERGDGLGAGRSQDE